MSFRSNNLFWLTPPRLPKRQPRPPSAYYWLRWENTKGETGPWSAMVSATITG
ncbi:MAG: hypothetical protein AABP62_02975 [Planctomycetota bacterium]